MKENLLLHLISILYIVSIGAWCLSLYMVLSGNIPYVITVFLSLYIAKKIVEAGQRINYTKFDETILCYTGLAIPVGIAIAVSLIITYILHIHPPNLDQYLRTTIAIMLATPFTALTWYIYLTRIP